MNGTSGSAFTNELDNESGAAETETGTASVIPPARPAKTAGHGRLIVISWHPLRRTYVRAL